MRKSAREAALVVILLLAAAVCILNAWATVDLYYDLPGAGRQATLYLAGFALLTATAIWRLVVALEYWRRESRHHEAAR